MSNITISRIWLPAGRLATDGGALDTQYRPKPMAVKKTSDNSKIGKGKPGPGRPKGRPNNATLGLREVIARILEGNAENLGLWLTSIAEGEKEPRMRDGKPVLDERGNPVMKWRRAPDPGYALRLALDMAEYHMPKLARTELSGEIGIRGQLIISD